LIYSFSRWCCYSDTTDDYYNPDPTKVLISGSQAGMIKQRKEAINEVKEIINYIKEIT
jgi:arginine/lysine/ornithine decarboxylase